MDSAKRLRLEYVELVKSTHRQGILGRQFIHLQSLIKANEFPEFISNVVNQFSADTERFFPKLDLAHQQKLIDPEVKDRVHRIKGSGTSVGAKKVAALCLAFQDCYDTGDYEKCLEFIPQIKEEYHSAKDKLLKMLSLQQQIIAAGGSIPILK